MLVNISTAHTEPDGAIRTQIQDNYQAEIISVKMCRKLADVSLAVNTAVDNRTVTLAGGHGTVVGNVLCLRQDGRYYQGIVTVVATNVITLNMPLDYAFTTSAVAFRSSDAVNVDGSATPVIFALSPPSGTKWDIYGVSLVMQDDVAMDDGKFGGITALTNGLLFRKKDGDYKNVLFSRSNGEFALKGSTTKYNDKAPAGVYGVTIDTRFPDTYGAVLRIDAEMGEEMQLIVQDNLTGLSSFLAVAYGHKVE